METVLEYKCPSCGGAISFDTKAQKMKCPYCDTEFELEALKELDEALKQVQADDLNWEGQAGSQWEESEREQLAGFVCKSCGGEILCEQTTAATHCPYCDNPVVMTERVAGQLRPDLVIPFQLDKEAAKQALRKHVSGKMLLPKIFKSENRIEKIQGVYVPFWLFDAKSDGDVRYRTTDVHTWSDSKYIYTRTRHFSVHRAGNLRFQNVPVDGSQKMDDALMESIEPYDMTKAVDFQTAYLAGYLADRYDVDSQNSQQRASMRIKTSTEDALRNTVIGYTTCTPVSSSVRLSDSKIRYALLPVWMLNTRYKDKNYVFAMNGQTGKFVGDLPVDWGKFFLWWGGIAVAVTAVAYGIAMLL